MRKSQHDEEEEEQLELVDEIMDEVHGPVDDEDGEDLTGDEEDGSENDDESSDDDADLDAAATAPSDDYNPPASLKLADIHRATGISVITLSRYAIDYPDRMNGLYEGKGHGRRFYPKAIDVFESIRREKGGGKRGRPPGRKNATITGPNMTTAAGPPVASTAPRGRRRVPTQDQASMRRGVAARAVARGRIISPVPEQTEPKSTAAKAMQHAHLLTQLEILDEIITPLLEKRAYLRGLAGISTAGEE